MPVFVRNCKPGPTVYQDSGSNTVIEWQGAGDPSGQDVQQIPDEFANHMQIMKMLRLGVLQALDADDPLVSERFGRQAASYEAGVRDTSDEALSRLDTAAEKPLVTVDAATFEREADVARTVRDIQR